MKRINWELMRPEDIEIRPAMVKDGKATLLLYQNSRTAMDALDRNFGEFGWKIEYKAVGEQIYGCLSIKDPETGEWVCKEDTGSESNIEAQKGQSSDILKRCAVRFGYGRELYTAPRIVIEDDKYGNTGYKVSRIEYNENREIVVLEIVNRFNKPVFDWKDDRYVNTPKQTISPETPKSNGNYEALIKFCSALKLTLDEEGVKELKEFYQYWGVQNREKLDNWQGPFKPEKLWQNRPKNN